ncbi:MAG: hypothetical protein ACOX0Q_10855 [Syntrophomonadaceae bacterium]
MTTTSQLVVSLYNNILEQVMQLESRKKEISTEILLAREERKRLALIYNFLSYDLSKHELLEQAAVIALTNREQRVLDHLNRLYYTVEEQETIDKIRHEIKCTQRFMKVVNRAQENKSALTFSERRMVQEIVKFVVAQARLYNQL